MFVELEFENPVNKNKIKYQKKVPEDLENQLREFIEVVSQKNSMLILPIQVKIIDGDKSFSTMIFVSTLVEKSGHCLRINDTTKPEKVPTVQINENNDYNNHETFLEKVRRFFNGFRN